MIGTSDQPGWLAEGRTFILVFLFLQGQAAAEVATAPTPGLPPSDKIPPVKP